MKKIGKINPLILSLVAINYFCGIAFAQSQAGGNSSTIQYGIDVSHYQPNIDWATVAQSKSFVYVKAAYSTLTDPFFTTHASAAKKAGLLVGAYYFAYPTYDDPVPAARYFVNVAKDYIGNGNLPPAIDIERDGAYDPSSLSTQALSDWIRSWASEVEKLTGVRPIIYTQRSYARNELDANLAQNYSLWVAAYPFDPSASPATLGGLGNWQRWTFLQYQKGEAHDIWVNGVGYVDVDSFIGSYADLKALTGSSASLTGSASYFDGTGSLVDPRKSGYGCAGQDNNGCDNDLVKLHPRSTPSTALFQVVSVPGYCDSIELSGLNGRGKVEIRSWNGYGTESIYYELDSLPATIPLKNGNSNWNLVALTTTAPVPANETRTIKAQCKGTSITSSNAHKLSSGSPTQFGGDYYWGGNGSIIGHSNSSDNRDAQDGYGRMQDAVVLMRDHGTISAIQVTAASCKNLRFTTPVPIKVSWKIWNQPNWAGSTTINDQGTLNLNTGIGNNWGVLMIQAPATGQNNSRVNAVCY